MAVLAVTGCSSTDEADDRSADSGTEPRTVGFGAYLQRGVTRAGATGELTSGVLQSEGFGVMGYHSRGELFSEACQPNFMYNQQVSYTAGRWQYEPVKYWPNETAADRLTFFAYAPYVNVGATGVVDGDGTTGIGAVAGSATAGTPWVRYYGSVVPAASVDLCWAAPVYDQTKPAVGETVDFLFSHALAKLNVQVDTEADASAALDGQTRIYVRQVTFEGFALKGLLDLGSTGGVPTWLDVLGGSSIGSRPVTIHDGRRDGKEGALAAPSEQPTGLNPDVVQSAGYTTAPSFGSATPGVTATARNLFGDAVTATAPVFVIPTGDALRVTIVYDVETYDEKLVSGHLSDGTTCGSTIENTVTAVITTGGGTPLVLEAGRQYVVRLHLGLTSVQTEATVTSWEVTETPVSVDASHTVTSWGDGGTTAGSVDMGD